MERNFIQKNIELAYETGQEVMVYIRGLEEPFRGSIRECGPTHFSLFHNGAKMGMLWAFRLQDVRTIALMIPLPSDPDEEKRIDADLPVTIKDTPQS